MVLGNLGDISLLKGALYMGNNSDYYILMSAVKKLNINGFPDF